MEFRLTEDLYLAKEEFQTKKLALVFVKHTEVLYTDVQSSLLPLIKAIEQLKERAKGATVVDKVIGRAAAMLLIQAQVEQVYSPTMSEGARELFNQARIKNDALSVVSEILAPDGQNQCMMERLVANISDPAEGRKVLLNFFREKEML